MRQTYTCNRCGRKFTNKGGYVEHRKGECNKRKAGETPPIKHNGSKTERISLCCGKQMEYCEIKKVMVCPVCGLSPWELTRESKTGKGIVANILKKKNYPYRERR